MKGENLGKTTRERLEACDKTIKELESSLGGLKKSLKIAMDMVKNNETMEDVDMLVEAINDKLMLAGANIIDADYIADSVVRMLTNRRLNKAFNAIRVADAVRRAIDEIRKLKAEAAEKDKPGRTERAEKDAKEVVEK